MKTAFPLMPLGTPPRRGKSALFFKIPRLAALLARRIPRLVGALCALAFCSSQVQAAPAATNQPGVQLTIELRDDSRVVGKTLEDTLSLHSVALGDMKLSWAGIRSIEYAGTNTSVARLTATNGDAFAVTIAAETLRVETGFGQTEMPVKLIRSVKTSPSAMANAAAGAEPPRLTIELRDGSHIVGKGLDDTLDFHSPAMGDLKLTWAGIRSIEYAGTNTSTARLTATNGDVYEVQFEAPAVRVETSFGKTELPVKLIRNIKAAQAHAQSSLANGLVAYYPFHGNADDASGNRNNGFVYGATLSDDRSGNPNSAYSFDGFNGYIQVPASSQFDTGTHTITLWVKPMPWPMAHPWVDLISKDNEAPGQREWVIQEKQSGQIRSGVFTSSGEHTLDTIGTLKKGEWSQVAVVWDGITEQVFIDGNLDSSIPAAGALVVADTAVRIGASRIASQLNFCGSMGDIRIYDRALSPSEAQALYEEENNGEPLPARLAPGTVPGRMPGMPRRARDGAGPYD